MFDAEAQSFYSRLCGDQGVTGGPSARRPYGRRADREVSADDTFSALLRAFA
jgi:hypothetical protein